MRYNPDAIEPCNCPYCERDDMSPEVPYICEWSRRFIYGGKAVKLTKRSYDILLVLMKYKRKPMPIDRLCAAAGMTLSYYDCGGHSGSNVMKNIRSELDREYGTEARAWILTDLGTGYAWYGPHVRIGTGKPYL